MLGARKQVLIVQTAFLGDLLLSVPLLKNLRLSIPQCEIHLVCRKGLSPLFLELGLIDHGYEIQKKNSQSYQSVVENTRGTFFDLILSPHESFTSGRLVKKLKSPVKIGFSSWWNFLFFHERIQRDLALPEALRQLSLLENRIPDLKAKLRSFKKMQISFEKIHPGKLAPVPEWASPEIELKLPFSDIKTQLVSDLGSHFSLPDQFVCLFPGSVWATKQWTPEGFVEIGNRYSQEGKAILIMGGPGEESLGERVASQIPGSLNLVNRTSLMQTLVILKSASLVVTNDSAGQHLAALVLAPTLSIFGPTVLKFGYRPWNSKAMVIERKDLLCRPCGKHGHQQCPLGTHECMKSIRAKEVYESSQSL